MSIFKDILNLLIFTLPDNKNAYETIQYMEYFIV